MNRPGDGIFDKVSPAAYGVERGSGDADTGMTLAESEWAQSVAKLAMAVNEVASLHTKQLAADGAEQARRMLAACRRDNDRLSLEIERLRKDNDAYRRGVDQLKKYLSSFYAASRDAAEEFGLGVD